MRVLHIERDQVVAEAVDLMLRVDGIVPYRTDEAAEGLDLAKHYDFDVILVEPMGLEMSGAELLRRLRLAKVTTPVMIVSGIVSVDDKVRLLHAGADDHLAKPFHKDELVARIGAVVRRSHGHAESTVTIGDLVVSLDAKAVRVGDMPLHLTGKEYAIIELLALRKGVVLT
ncbi:response regulator, partial [Beijerinckia sp. L45]|uniref:response regulator n=1 Tax=Beijerinckia sp. L45 TaxID=1641855 RepID=UPI00131C38D5